MRQERLAALDYAGLAQTLVADVRRRMEYIGRCEREAESALRGDLTAAIRLWLLLKDPIEGGVQVPPAVREEIASDVACGRHAP